MKRYFFLMIFFSTSALVSGPASWSAAPEAPAKMRWVSYRSNILRIQVTVPSGWVAVKSKTALGFHTPGAAAGRAAIGIMKSSSGQTIEEAAEHQFEDAGRPEEWVRSNARVGGRPAIKIIGWNKRNPGFKLVQYYVQSPQGPYLIQCLAPEETWNLYSPLFAQMLSRLQFIP